MTTPAFTRAVTIFAVGFLLLDAVLLALANYFAWAAACAVLAVLVVAIWFRYRRTLRELIDEGKEIKREVESIRQLLNSHRRQ